jgi:hypothetical protein
MIDSRIGMNTDASLADSRMPKLTDDGCITSASYANKAPFCEVLRSPHSNYVVKLLANGRSVSYLAGRAITPEHGAGKALFIRDNETGKTWSAFHDSHANTGRYAVTYAPGEVIVRSLVSKIESWLRVTPSLDRPCELWLLRIRNNSASPRSLTITSYFEPVLEGTADFRYFPKDKAILMRQALSILEIDADDDSEMTIFHGCTLTPAAHATDRSLFVDGGLGAVVSLTVKIELPIEGEAVIGFCTGAAANAKEALEHVRSYGKIDNLASSVESASKAWESLTLELHSPDDSINAFVTKWLGYFSVSEARRGGISAFDRLRALYPVCRAFAEETRTAILACTEAMTLANTLVDQDGVCVRFTESDSVWLAATVARLVAETRDSSLLEKKVALADGPTLTIQEHCERILRMCLNSNSPSLDWQMVDRVIRDWRLLPGNAEKFDRYVIGLAARKLSVPSAPPEQILPPRRLDYLQTLCPTLPGIIDWNKLPTDAGEADVLRHFIEHALGLHVSWAGIELEPRVSLPWPECRVTLRIADDSYHITLRRASSNKRGNFTLMIDGEPMLGCAVPFIGDGKSHEVIVSEY